MFVPNLFINWSGTNLKGLGVSPEATLQSCHRSVMLPPQPSCSALQLLYSLLAKDFQLLDSGAHLCLGMLQVWGKGRAGSWSRGVRSGRRRLQPPRDQLAGVGHRTP